MAAKYIFQGSAVTSVVIPYVVPVTFIFNLAENVEELGSYSQLS